LLVEEKIDELLNTQYEGFLHLSDWKKAAVGGSFDGASVMLGSQHGTAKLLKDTVETHLTITHAAAHVEQLALGATGSFLPSPDARRRPARAVGAWPRAFRAPVRRESSWFEVTRRPGAEGERSRADTDGEFRVEGEASRIPIDISDRYRYR